MMILKNGIFITLALALFTNANEAFSPLDWAGQVFLSSNSSRLWIEGSSNVNKWSCESERPFGKGGIRADAGYHLDNEDLWAWLEVPISTFDCGNPVMNKDFKNSLKAESHPVVRFELIKANSEPQIKMDRAQVSVTGKLSTAGVTKEITFPAEIIKTNNGFRVIGEDSLQMPDFQIEPPTALFGLIKASPKIRIHFDIIAEPLILGRQGADNL